MPDIQTAQALQPWRLTVYFAAADAGLDDPIKFHLSRGGVVPHPIETVWLRGTGVVELALGDALLAGEDYLLQHDTSSTTAHIAWRPAQPSALARPRTTTDGPELDDPEAEAFGLDVDWFGAALDARGDVPVVRGLQALKHDLAAVAFMSPGDLVHRPRAGVGVRQRVNGASNAATLGEIQADVRAAYLSDPRVRDCTVKATREGERTALRTSVLTPPLLGDSIDFTTRL